MSLSLSLSLGSVALTSLHLCTAEELQPLLLEHTSGGCNILHVLSLLGRPPVPSRSPSPHSAVGDRRSMAARTTPRSGVLREIMKQAMALASSSGPAPSLGELYLELGHIRLAVPLLPPDPPDAVPWASDEGESDSSPPSPSPSYSSAAPSVVSLCLGQLSLVLAQSPAPLTSLLCEKNIEGHTPFMTAVTYKVHVHDCTRLQLPVSFSLLPTLPPSLSLSLSPSPLPPSPLPHFPPSLPPSLPPPSLPPFPLGLLSCHAATGTSHVCV